mgnify:CR=1 FL=1
MNDFDFDIVEKKRMARGARCKKNGSKSKRCTLPSDNLTPAQRKALSGPVSSWSINQPMTWEVFVAAPHDVQQSYIDALQNRFGVGLATISKEMFGLAVSSLRNHMVRKGLKFSTDKKGSRLNAVQREIWENWLHGAEKIDPPEEEDTVEDGEEEVQQADRFAAKSIAVEFAGTFDPHEFVKLLAQLPIPDGRIRVKVEVLEE